MENKKVLFFGSYPGPMTGQAISFKEAYDNYSGKKILVNTTKFNNKILNSLYCLFSLPLIFVFKKFPIVYFTCVRSKLGAIKDIQLLLLCKLFNKKVINHLHGADFKIFYNASNTLKPLLEYCYNKIDVSIVLLPSMKEQFSDFLDMKIEVIQNCYSTEMESINVDFANKKKQILYLSNLINSKGIFIFMEAAGQLLDEDPNIIVKIGGVPMNDEEMSEKEISEKFQNIYKDLKLKYPDRILYMGEVKGDEKVKTLLESSIFILPTFYAMEAFPITIIEAMRFGNAVITTNHNYLSDIVNDKNGKLVNKKSSAEIVNTVKYLFSSPEKLKEIQKYNEIESREKYSPQKYNLAIKEAINNL